MNMTKWVIGLAGLAFAGLENPAEQAFGVVPGGGHPAVPSDLAWMDQAKVSLSAASTPEVAATLSAPNVRVSFGLLRKPAQGDADPDSLGPNVEDISLRIGTGLAWSQISPEQLPWDISLGATFARDRLSIRSTSVEAARQWVDLSTSVRVGTWTVSAVLAEMLEIPGDTAWRSDSRVELRLGQSLESGTRWGGELSLPVEDNGEVSGGAGIGRSFRDALEFEGAIESSYERRWVPQEQRSRWMQNDLVLRMGTRLKFRPWVRSEDPEWMRSVLEPAGFSSGDGFLLRGWELGLGAGWDLIHGRAVSSISVSRWF